MKNSILVFILSFTFSASSWAAELYEQNLSVRALGMGNAHTAAVDDAYALFYNPARLGAVDGFNFRLMDPYILVSDPTRVQALLDSQSGGGSFQDTIDPFFGEPASTGLGTRAAFTMPRFGVALYGDAQIGINLNNPVLPDLELRALADYGLAIGGSFPILPTFEVGAVIRRVIRQGGNLQIDAATVAELNTDAIVEETQRKGAAFAMDLGATITAPGPVDASLSFVWKDVGNTTFKHTEGPGAPPGVEQEMIIGAQAGMDLVVASVRGVFDYKYLNRSDVQLAKKIHIGFEVSTLLMDVRAGMSQGYYTLGAGIGLGLLELDIATYGVELGEFPGQLEDRRYAIQLTLELGVDPFIDLGGDSSAGKRSSRRKTRRRGIKQRR